MEASNGPYNKTIIINEAPVPDTVKAILDEASNTYTLSFQLTKDEYDALKEWGTNAEQEVDNVIRQAKGVIATYAHAYAVDCFNKGVPLDCMCKKTLFRRFCEARKKSSQS